MPGVTSLPEPLRSSAALSDVSQPDSTGASIKTQLLLTPAESQPRHHKSSTVGDVTGTDCGRDRLWPGQKMLLVFLVALSAPKT